MLNKNFISDIHSEITKIINDSENLTSSTKSPEPKINFIPIKKQRRPFHTLSHEEQMHYMDEGCG